MRHIALLQWRLPHLVSIHAPREGCDSFTLSNARAMASFNSRTPGGVRRSSTWVCLGCHRFQFTHPGRGATCPLILFPDLCHVSIHAPREGCDFDVIGCNEIDPRFNSRTPGGVRLMAGSTSSHTQSWFQFTHPGRGATCISSFPQDYDFGFNSRTPGGVRRVQRPHGANHRTCFNSRTPGGVRLLHLSL